MSYPFRLYSSFRVHPFNKKAQIVVSNKMVYRKVWESYLRHRHQRLQKSDLDPNDLLQKITFRWRSSPDPRCDLASNIAFTSLDSHLHIFVPAFEASL